MTTYFPSARSKTLGLIVWSLLLVPMGLALYEVFQVSISSELILRIGIIVLVLLFFGIIWFGTGYHISDQKLIVKVGPVTHSKIDISKISEISKTKSWICAPANSLKRLAIKSHDSILVIISPRDQKTFIDSIKNLNPEININI